MKKITILGFDYVMSSAITGVLDLFCMAGVTWNKIHGNPIHPFFQVEIANIEGVPIRCINNVSISVNQSIQEVRQTDLLLIPSIAGNIEKTLTINQKAIPWIRRLYKKGTPIASNCTGAFFLGEAGLLDGKPATTHWGFVDLFKKRYPRVILKPERMITSESNLFCSGGGIAWLDLALYLLELYCGHEVAVECAKSYVIDMGRNSQKEYISLIGSKYHQDSDILKAQKWIERNYSETIRVDQISSRFGMSSRTFQRRFKNATGETPLTYLQYLRIESAKKILENSDTTLDEITNRIGYDNTSSFIKLFKKRTGLTPTAYRKKFQKRFSIDKSEN